MPTIEQIYDAVNRLSIERGWLFGAPVMSFTEPEHRMVIAKGSPLKGEYEQIYKTAAEEHLPADLEVVNSWMVLGHDVIIAKEKSTGKLMTFKYPHCADRMSMAILTAGIRMGATSWHAEIRAQQQLAWYVGDGQFSSYVFSGYIFEKSRRSHVHYIFRKGRPTLAFTERNKNGDLGDSLHFLAALCCHPIAYYEGTWAGSMCPTDEVIAHLLMMRGDEKFFWRVSNIHTQYDPRSGV